MSQLMLGTICGLVFGVLLSLADAIITKAYLPILAFGDIGSAITAPLSASGAGRRIMECGDWSPLC